MNGYGRAYGAITVINAFATGIGAALGINLGVETHVKSCCETKINMFVQNQKKKMSGNLIYEIMKIIKKKYELLEETCLTIYSEIPPEKGLKSSSAVANAVIIALADTFDLDLTYKDILNINVEASLNAGVSLTGALDDAAASLLGGLVITNNLNREIIKKQSIRKHNVIITYPSDNVKTSLFKNMNFEPIRKPVKIAINKALSGKWIDSMLLNGLIYASYLGYPTKPIFQAIENGAYTASLSGKGPAYAAIAEDTKPIKKVWREKLKWNIITTELR